MQICTHPLDSMWFNLFSRRYLIVQQSLSKLAILTQEHDVSSVYLRFQQIKAVHLCFTLFLEKKSFHNARIWNSVMKWSIQALWYTSLALLILQDKLVAWRKQELTTLKTMHYVPLFLCYHGENGLVRTINKYMDNIAHRLTHHKKELWNAMSLPTLTSFTGYDY